MSLAAPVLGQVYYRTPICLRCNGTGLWRCTRCRPRHVEFCVCQDIWGDDDDPCPTGSDS